LVRKGRLKPSSRTCIGTNFDRRLEPKEAECLVRKQYPSKVPTHRLQMLAQALTEPAQKRVRLVGLGFF